MPNYDPNTKRLGDYLVDAGLLSAAQVQVILQDQKISPLRFGELVLQRGWINEKTLNFIIQKVVIMEREMGQPMQEKVFLEKKKQKKSKNKEI